MIYLQLLWSFVLVGLFSFGGGYASLPLIQHQVVTLHHWLTLGEFTDLIAISQMTPGPIALNTATFVGYRLAGPLGAVSATVGCVLPCCLISLTLAWVYSKYSKVAWISGALSGLRPAVVALICSAGLSILTLALWQNGPISLQNTNWLAAVLFALGLILLRRFKPNPIWVMLGCGVVGGVAAISY